MKQVKRVSVLILVLILISVLYYGCDEEPKTERDTLVKVYVEKTIAQNKYADLPTSLDSAKKSIFSKYNLTEEQFNTTMENMEPNSEYWEAFFKEAKVYLDSLRNFTQN